MAVLGLPVGADDDTPSEPIFVSIARLADPLILMILFVLFSWWEGRYRWPANSPDSPATWHSAVFFKRGINDKLFVWGNFLPWLQIIGASLLWFKVRDRNVEHKRSELCTDYGAETLPVCLLFHSCFLPSAVRPLRQHNT